ncbi:hypothetical protein FB451DRAFT_1258341 [Mycena latifolia]|nr:hypothetical protein FB451DRAFT_1258341 [Mycena latifolia]
MPHSLAAGEFLLHSLPLAQLCLSPSHLSISACDPYTLSQPPFLVPRRPSSLSSRYSLCLEIHRSLWRSTACCQWWKTVPVSV